ncbi:Hypothetical protein NTJ_09977 [Nesidiocoris tenuis]|uniref:Uncharacterized protein n=1 Tax=Nesidiocoris tenuis TaxID=355587 RepID=A0ABN7AYU6_9HEMI|nr:Hypothetical protein NTJ_09977 [Nesidiocoris tenuis]
MLQYFFHLVSPASLKQLNRKDVSQVSGQTITRVQYNRVKVTFLVVGGTGMWMQPMEKMHEPSDSEERKSKIRLGTNLREEVRGGQVARSVRKVSSPLPDDSPTCVTNRIMTENREGGLGVN